MLRILAYWTCKYVEIYVIKQYGYDKKNLYLNHLLIVV